MSTFKCAHKCKLSKYSTIYKNQEDGLPEWVASASDFKEFEFGPVQFSVGCMGMT
jgi:hypothetical protein